MLNVKYSKLSSKCFARHKSQIYSKIREENVFWRECGKKLQNYKIIRPAFSIKFSESKLRKKLYYMPIISSILQCERNGKKQRKQRKKDCERERALKALFSMILSLR